MTSRKRNKGKDRKAKKAALEAERVESERSALRSVWHAWACGDLTSGKITCDHGLLIPDENNHPVCSFMDTFFVNGMRKNIANAPNMRDTFQRHAEVWKNESYRKMATNIMTRIGTNWLLSDTDDSNWLPISYAVMVLENYDGRGDVDLSIYSRGNLSKLRDIHCVDTSNIRDALKFYRKRTTCSCLRRMHLEARKTFPKLGMCSHCEERKERSLLMVCSRCRITQYCSRACQIRDWPEHKTLCGLYVKAQQKHTLNSAACDRTNNLA